MSWIYWAYNHGSQDYQIVKEYIDLAVKMKWPYDLIDWEWDVMRNGGNIQDAVKYALSQGVKPLVWYNSSTNWIGPGPLFRLNKKADREKEYKWLSDMGVAGIKVAFFSGDSVSTMNYYIDLLEDAVKYKLMLNFHGATIPHYIPFPIDQIIRPLHLDCQIDVFLHDLIILRTMVICPINP